MVQHVDPSVELVVCGHDTEWNRRCIDKLRHHMNFVDHYSIHRYWINGGHGTSFTEDDYYALLDEADQTEDFIIETRNFLEEATGGRKKVGIALDEWGVWHPEARTWGPGPIADGLHDYTQAGTMRDAIATAVGLEVFHRQCDSLSMANLAQIVNVLHAPIMTDEAGCMWLTPTYYILQMHRVHIGQEAYPVTISGGETLPNGRPAVSATASNGGLTITNRHMTQSAEVKIPIKYTTGTILTSNQPNKQNSASRAAISPKQLVIQDGKIHLPPHSVATVY
jgi:alpha-N-arabinofuranosidase